MYMYVHSLRQGKARQLRLKRTPLFPKRREELPQVGFEPTTFCVLGGSSGQAKSLNVIQGQKHLFPDKHFSIERRGNMYKLPLQYNVCTYTLVWWC